MPKTGSMTLNREYMDGIVAEEFEVKGAKVGCETQQPVYAARQSEGGYGGDWIRYLFGFFVAVIIIWIILWFFNSECFRCKDKDGKPSCERDMCKMLLAAIIGAFILLILYAVFCGCRRGGY